MASPESLYKIFDLQADCSNDELRRVYRRLLLENHPDLNPNNIVEATKKTQQINDAYSRLKEYRENPGQFSLEVSSGWNIEFKISFDFGGVDKKDIARRKDAFSAAWAAFHRQPSDVFMALRLIHAAFEAERYKEIIELLENPIIIDSSALLLNLVDRDAAINTLVRLADQLRYFHLAELGVQILEDAYSAGENRDSIRDELRGFHYGIAQGYWKDPELKPIPKVRVTHLARIIEIGFDLDYIHKLLAEAYHEMGDDITAVAHLRKAYEINPELSGAVRISRTLGFLPKSDTQPVPHKERAKYIFTRPEQIPHPSQIRQWAGSGNWDQIFVFCDLAKYSPRIIPSARSTIRQIAQSLGDCPDEKAKEFLLAYKTSVYWDVREACQSSLDRFGQKYTLSVTFDSNAIDSKDIESQLWSQLVFESYHPASDEGYLEAINILATQVLTSNDPDVMLGSLRRMTRWLELLGMGEMTQWIRELIRREAPGTWYVDSHDRINYIRNVHISEYLSNLLTPILTTIQQTAPIRLSQVLSTSALLKKPKTSRQVLKSKTDTNE